jgi:hypothetical protein
MNWNDLREYAQFNKDFLAEVSSGIREGRTVDQIAADWTLDEKYQGYQIQEARLKTNVQIIANELKK